MEMNPQAWKLETFEDELILCHQDKNYKTMTIVAQDDDDLRDNLAEAICLLRDMADPRKWKPSS